MREVKFKAWDEENKRWITHGLYLTPEGKLLEWNNEKQAFQPCLYKLCFFTGFLDKNGKEIYEGDVVKSKNRYNSTPEKYPRYEIVFNEGSFYGSSLKRHTVTGKGLRWLTLNLGDHSEMSTSEVIGNIYENPELMK